MTKQFCDCCGKTGVAIKKWNIGAGSTFRGLRYEFCVRCSDIMLLKVKEFVAENKKCENQKK